MKEFGIPLVKTKLFIPQVRQDHVRRSRILAQLNKGLHYSLTLVSSLPGSGKTSALAEWVSRLTIPAGWVSLDGSDNDPDRFLRYIATALHSIFPAAAQTALGELDSPERLSSEAVMASLINDLSDQAREFVLVLDDFHVIHSSAIQSSVAYFLDHQPPQAHLVIATRTDPRLPLARLRARQQILELRMDDLRFTPTETDEYLNRIMGLSLSQDDLLALETRTEGWIASLQMAALSLKHAPDHKGFIQAFSGSNRYVMDYLVEEVLNLQPESVQKFLLQTSILERLNGALCDAVCCEGSAEDAQRVVNRDAAGRGQEMLEFLERSNLFIIPLDEDRNWYRYHHLFANLLRARLAHSTLSSTQTLHLRAADWFERQGYPEDAIQHALAAQDFPLAARLVEGVAESVWFHGQYSRLTGWIKALPPDLVQRSPVLCVWTAWSYSQTGVPSDVNLWIERAEAAVQKRNPGLSGANTAFPEFQALRYEIAALKVLTACLAQDYDRAVLLAVDVLENPPPERTRSSLMAQCHTYHGLSYKYFTDGDLVKAEQVNLEIIRISKEIGFTLRQLHGTNKLAFVHKTAGQLQRCYRLIQETLTYLQEQELSGYFSVGAMHCRLVDLLYEWDQIEESNQIIENQIKPERFADVPYLLLDFYNIRARNFLLERDFSAAQDLLNKGFALSQQSYIWPGLAWQTELLQVRLWLKKGDLAKTAAWAAEKPAQWVGLPPFSSESREINRARVLMAGGSHPEALTLLEHLAASATLGGRKGSLVEIFTLQAIALQAAGQKVHALSALEQALALGKPEGYCRTFVDEGGALAPLLARLARKNRSLYCHYARQLLAKIENELEHGVQQPIMAGESEGSPQSTLIEPLSRRELEVLRCMAAGLPNQETARKLVIETSTVKRHIHSIFAKMGVTNRVQALNKAKESKIL